MRLTHRKLLNQRIYFNGPMKKSLFLLLLPAIFVSCNTAKVLPPEQYSACIDYGYLAQKGVFLTESNSVNFDYEPLGSLYIECKGGWVKNDKRASGDAMEDIYMNKNAKYVYRPATVEEAFDMALGELKRIRGNGIINLKINTISEYVPAYLVTVNKIIITGMCIRK